MSTHAARTGGLAGILAAALFAGTAVIDTAAPIDAVYDAPSEIVYLVASTVAFLAVVVAVVGIRALLARSGQLTRPARVATWLVGVGYGVVALLTAGNLVAGQRSLVMVRLGFAVVMLLGSVILGVVIFRTRTLPVWCAGLLIIAFPLGHVANALFSSAENLLMMLLWGSVGLALLAASSMRGAGPSRASF